jgi:hypothetical protein
MQVSDCWIKGIGTFGRERLTGGLLVIVREQLARACRHGARILGLGQRLDQRPHIGQHGDATGLLHAGHIGQQRVQGQRAATVAACATDVDGQHAAEFFW